MNFSSRFRADREGAAMVEFAIVFPMLLLLIGGIVDFGLAFWQMNMAAKAVERGARIAAVSNPVASGYEKIDTGNGGGPPSANFDIKCDGKTASCTCVSGTCGSVSYSATSMNTIVYGRGNGGTCNKSAAGLYALGMCNLFNRVDPEGSPLTPANVVVEYAAAPEAGFAGMPCGPLSTITVSLQNVTYGWFFLGGLMSLADLSFPSMRTTITSEDLYSANSNPNCS